MSLIDEMKSGCEHPLENYIWDYTHINCPECFNDYDGGEVWAALKEYVSNDQEQKKVPGT